MNGFGRLAAACAMGAAAVSAGGAATAQQNNDGGYHVAGVYDSYERDYAKVRGWSVKSYNDGGKRAYCVGVLSGRGGEVRLGLDAQGQWQLAVPVTVDPNWYGALEVDGRRTGASGTWVMGWAIAWLNIGQLEALKAGNRAILSFDKGDYDIPLRGSAATIAKVEECVQARRAVAAAPRPQGNVQPGFRPRTQQNAQPQSRFQRQQPQANAQPRPRFQPQAPAQPAAGTLIEQASGRCDMITYGNYVCTLHKLVPEAGYVDSMEVYPTDSQAPAFRVKVRADGYADVWTEDPAQQRWNFMGVWEQAPPNSGCIEPRQNFTQSPAAQGSLGQDAWNLCLR